MRSRPYGFLHEFLCNILPETALGDPVSLRNNSERKWHSRRHKDLCSRCPFRRKMRIDSSRVPKLKKQDFLKGTIFGALAYQIETFRNMPSKTRFAFPEFLAFQWKSSLMKSKKSHRRSSRRLSENGFFRGFLVLQPVSSFLCAHQIRNERNGSPDEPTRYQTVLSWKIARVCFRR